MLQLKKEILNVKQKILLLNSDSLQRNQFQNNKNIYVYGFNLEEEVLSILDKINLEPDVVYVVHNNNKISQKIFLRLLPKIENHFNLELQLLEFNEIKSELKLFKEKLNEQLEQEDDKVVVFSLF